MRVGDIEKESSVLTPTTEIMGATSEMPTSLASSSVSVTAPITSPPPLGSGPPLATTEYYKGSPMVVVCVPSSAISAAQPASIPETIQKEPALGEREESDTRLIKAKDVALGSGPDKKEPAAIISGSNEALLTPGNVASGIVHAESKSGGAYVISSTTHVQGLIPSSPRFPLVTASSSFQSSQSILADYDKSKMPPPFLSRPPPLPPLSIFPPSFSNVSLSKTGGPNRFAYGGGAPTNGNVPSSSHSYLLSSMRPPISGPSQPHYATAGHGGIPLSVRAHAILPVPSSSGSIASHLHESQYRSYSFPRGPPPPSISYGIGRNHSWPSETSGHSLASLRPPMLASSPAPPPFLSSAFTQGPLQRGGIRPPQTLRISKWVNPIPPDPDDGQQQTGEQELATKMLQIQSKRFYIDVKQNRRGRFMKVAEIGADGRRNQVFLALSTAAEFRDHLSMFSEFYSNLGPPNPDTLPEDGKLKSETMVKDNRRYYLDLKENSRGRFLRVSQTIARGGPRCQIAIPAQGMIEFRDALQELLEEFGTDDGGFKGELPEGRHMRVENKNFYFDIGQNNRGIYMRISEVKTNFRTAITIPEKSWSRFRDIFADYVDKMKEGGDKNSSESNK